MRSIMVNKNEAGQRLDKLLAKYLNLAGKGFLYKMMRKKNIVLNGKKCDGSEKLAEGDEIKLFLADETIEKFSEVKVQKVKKTKLHIIYEDEHVVLINKPSGMLSQKAKEQDESLVEYLIDHLLDSGKLTKEDLRSFRPSVCNRLDRNTTGVLLLTNDGDLASKLTHPKFVKKKIYHVWTDKPIAEEDMQRIADGIELDDGEIHADEVSYVSETDRKQAGIEIHSGRNRIVRRIFESLGYRVVKLDRVYFAGLTKKNLPRGKWRYLSQDEVNHLRQGSFE